MRLLKFRRVQLENGLVLLFSESRRIPIVTVNAFVLAGVDRNPISKPGLAALTFRLLDEGTRRFTTDGLAEILEGSGSSLSIYSQRELSVISLQLRDSNLRMGLELLFEMLCHPTFPKERVESEREKVLAHLSSMADEAPTIGSQLLNRAIYAGTPFQFPTLGTQESVKKIKRKEIADFHRRTVAPFTTFIVVVGSAAYGKTLHSVREIFSGWSNPGPRRAALRKLQRQKHPITVHHELDRDQVHIYIGHLGVTRRNPDFHALQVLDVILGSGPGFTSRIPRRLRDELGLAYSTYSDISGSSGVYPGRFAAYICTSEENAERARLGLLGEIQNLIENGITQEELETAQDYLTGSFVFELQANTSVSRLLLSMELFELGRDYLEKYPSLIRSVTREEVARVARIYLDTLNYTTISVGPRRNEFFHNPLAETSVHL